MLRVPVPSAFCSRRSCARCSVAAVEVHAALLLVDVHPPCLAAQVGPGAERTRAGTAQEGEGAWRGRTRCALVQASSVGAGGRAWSGWGLEACVGAAVQHEGAETGAGRRARRQG